MHLRGKDMRVWAELPDGTERDILWAPRCDFSWQIWYETADPMPIPSGSRIQDVAHYDNSANNPDPDAYVHFGEPAMAEMMFAFSSCNLPGEELQVLDPHVRRDSSTGGELTRA